MFRDSSSAVPKLSNHSTQISTQILKRKKGHKFEVNTCCHSDIGLMKVDFNSYLAKSIAHEDVNQIFLKAFRGMLFIINLKSETILLLKGIFR